MMGASRRTLPSFSPSEILSGEIPRVDLHVHTSFTDGVGTVESYARSAVEQRLKILAITEHVSRNQEWLDTWYHLFVKEVDRCRSAFPSLELYAGVEARVINYQGEINATPQCIDSVDFVIGVVHRYPEDDAIGPATPKPLPMGTARRIELQASLAVLENPQVSVIGHAGAVYGQSFGPLPLSDFDRIIQKAAQKGVAFEINAKYHKLIAKDLLKLCAKHGVRVTLGSDAHHEEELGGIVRLLRRELDQ